uniref:NEDD8-conjugating enzyme UBC12 n=1 Tax=Oncorhynchus kisutch TaxID=8019 RepID=A0A8C7F6E9_ONCKI
MIKLFSLKQQKKDEESAGGNRTGAGGKKASAAQLRIQKDINELNLPKTCEIVFPDQDDLLNFKLIISPDEGFYKGGKFVFSFKVGQGYPHDPPKVKCETMVYHPNIDLEGNVCLNILRYTTCTVVTLFSLSRLIIQNEYRILHFYYYIEQCLLTSLFLLQRGLEACVDSELHHIWTTVSISRAKSRGPFE